MAIVKDAVVQLKIALARDGKAAADAARTTQQIQGTVTQAEKAIQQEAKRTGAAIAGMVRELRRTRDEEQHLKRIAIGLNQAGIAADQARIAAARMIKEIGDGARVTTAEILRMAAALRALGQAGKHPEAQPAKPEKKPSFWNQSLGSIPLGGLGATVVAGSFLRGGAQHFSGMLSTSVDEQIREETRRGRPSSGVSGLEQGISDVLLAGVKSIPIVGEVAEAVENFFTRAARVGAERSARALQRLQTSLAEQDAQRGIRGQQREDERRILADGREVAGAATASGQAGRIRARQELVAFDASRRQEGIATREQDELRAFQRGQRIAGPSAIDMLSAEASRPRADATAGQRFELQAERARLQERLRDAQRRSTQQGAEAEVNVSRRPGQTRAETSVDTVQAAALQEQAQLRQRILENERQQIALGQQRGQQSRAELESLRERARTQAEMYRGMAEAERQRVQGAREGFGQLDPERRRELMMAAQDVERQRRDGGALSEQTQQTILNNRQMFGQVGADVAARRGDAAGVQDFLRMIGQQSREQEFRREAQRADQKRVQFDQQIRNEITLNAEATAQALAESLVPLLVQATETLVANSRNEMERRLGEVERNRRATVR